MTINPTSLTSALYSNSKVAEANHVATLLKPGSSTSLLNQKSLLSSVNPIANGADNSSLIDFVKENVPQNGSLLADIAAINALNNFVSDDAPESSIFYNGYDQLLLQSQNKLNESTIGSGLNELI